MKVTSRGHRINYLTFGDAPDAIVLLHGHMQAAEDWESRGYPDLLTPKHQVIAIDLLGYGYSIGVVTAEAFAKQHPERVTGLICGGNLVNASPDDRQNMFMSGAELLERSGLEAYLDQTYPDVAPEHQEIRERFGSRNDGLAAAAAVRGVCVSGAAEDAPLPDKTLNYMGTDEEWFELVKAVAAQKGVAFTEVPGDHGGAFMDAEIITAKVLAFLDV